MLPLVQIAGMRAGDSMAHTASRANPFVPGYSEEHGAEIRGEQEDGVSNQKHIPARWPADAAPEGTYRIDDAGHRVPYTERSYVISRFVGSEETLRILLCRECFQCLLGNQ